MAKKNNLEGFGLVGFRLDPVEGCCEYCNESLGFIKRTEFLA